MYAFGFTNFENIYSENYKMKVIFFIDKLVVNAPVQEKSIICKNMKLILQYIFARILHWKKKVKLTVVYFELVLNQNKYILIYLSDIYFHFY